MFGRLCPSLLQPRGITDKMREAIRTAARRYSREELEALFRRAEGIPYLRGDTGSGKKFSLKGVLEKADRIMSGEFDPYEKETAPVEDVPEDWAEQWNKVNRYGGTRT
jgi:hypothetical protein